MPSINSKVIADHIESEIVRLVQCIQVEHKCNIDDAKETVRDLLIKKHNELMNNKDKESILKMNINPKLLKYLRLNG